MNSKTDQYNLKNKGKRSKKLTDWRSWRTISKYLTAIEISGEKRESKAKQDIWRNNDWNFSQFGKRKKFTALRVSESPKQNKSKKSRT